MHRPGRLSLGTFLASTRSHTIMMAAAAPIFSRVARRSSKLVARAGAASRSVQSSAAVAAGGGPFSFPPAIDHDGYWDVKRKADGTPDIAGAEAGAYHDGAWITEGRNGLLDLMVHHNRDAFTLTPQAADPVVDVCAPSSASGPMRVVKHTRCDNHLVLDYEIVATLASPDGNSKNVVLRAPEVGLVEKYLAQEGELVQPGQPVVRFRPTEQAFHENTAHKMWAVVLACSALGIAMAWFFIKGDHHKYDPAHDADRHAHHDH